ncbi:Thiaminase-2 [Legionella geestiana]|uniref:Thiaminase-2 n=1 Tax=Legionella geestiana TaxID=45065 RepID=A0A0W0TSZ0_9GAMM|nr:hypothetical protein [Legionella geestiana]KTC98474.1 Thiaminase-2 [Legionella geestiana]QBS13120.1 hypothetical protein E4T54_10435 [Legionella geestiana]STX54363.1 Thiaminase-2 [Legionella geestiana]
MFSHTPRHLWSHLFARTQSLSEQIISHPFNAALGNGSLSESDFRAYILQDLPYLEGHARGMITASRRAPDAAGQALLLRFANDTIAAEENIRRTFLEGSPSEPPPPLPMLNDFLKTLDETTSHAPDFGTVLAILIPCPWIYREIGLSLPAPAPSNPYAWWTDEYRNNPGFSEAVESLCAYARPHINAVHCPVQRERTIMVFEKGLQFEHDFFDTFSPRVSESLKIL